MTMRILATSWTKQRKSRSKTPLLRCAKRSRARERPSTMAGTPLILTNLSIVYSLTLGNKAGCLVNQRERTPARTITFTYQRLTSCI